jgi:hypothetical protein
MAKSSANKFSLNLSDGAAKAVREMAEEEETTLTNIIRSSIALRKFIMEQLKDGGIFLITKEGEDGRASIERVHFI